MTYRALSTAITTAAVFSAARAVLRRMRRIWSRICGRRSRSPDEFTDLETVLRIQHGCGVERERRARVIADPAQRQQRDARLRGCRSNPGGFHFQHRVFHFDCHPQDGLFAARGNRGAVHQARPAGLQGLFCCPAGIAGQIVQGQQRTGCTLFQPAVMPGNHHIPNAQIGLHCSGHAKGDDYLRAFGQQRAGCFTGPLQPNPGFDQQAVQIAQMEAETAKRPQPAGLPIRDAPQECTAFFRHCRNQTDQVHGAL